MDREPALLTPWKDPGELVGFVDELRAAGYNVGTSQYVAVQELVLALAARGEDLDAPERMRGLLGPILCGTPEEQANFRVRYDEWMARFRPEAPDISTDETGLEQELSILDRWSRWWKWVLADLLVVTVGVFAYFQIGLGPEGPLWERAAQSGVVALLVTAAWTVAWQLWWRYRAHLFLKHHSVSEHPEIQRVPVHSLMADLLPTLSLVRTAQNLRRRREVASNELDVSATVNATVRRGGWLTPVPGTRQVRPEYLILIDRTSFRDQQARLLEELVDRLEEYDVLIQCYYFDADPQICFPERQGRPVSLAHLAAKYRDHRLLVFSDAAGLFNTSTGELEPWFDELRRFEERALLSPIPPARLGRRATILGRELAVLPATSKGLDAWTRSFHSAAPATDSAKESAPLPADLTERPQRWIERDAPEASRIEGVLDRIAIHLGEAGFFWLCACAVYPAMHLNLTVYLGNVLRDGSGKKLLEPGRLAALTQLPWFRRGSMPNWLRLALLARLSRSQEQSVRAALNTLLLSTLQSGTGDFDLEIAHGPAHSGSRLAQGVLRRLTRRMPEDSPLRDHVFLDFVAGRRPLTFLVLEALRVRVGVRRGRAPEFSKVAWQGMATRLEHLIQAVSSLQRKVGRISVIQKEPASPKSRLIYKSPGLRLLRLAELLFSARNYRMVFEPVVRDLQDEHIEILAEYEKTGERFHLWKSRFVLVRGYWSFWAAVFAQLLISMMKLASKLASKLTS